MMDIPLTILIHGLHLSPWYMKPLEKKINQFGIIDPSLRLSQFDAAHRRTQ